MSDAKPSEVEEVARELFELDIGAASHINLYAADLLARWALRFRARAVREALEGAANRLERIVKMGELTEFANGVVQGHDNAARLLRRLADEVPDAD